MFGDYLVSRGQITSEQLYEALSIQKFKKSKIGRILVELETLNQSQLDSLLFEYLKPHCPLKVSELIQKKKNLIMPSEYSGQGSYKDLYIVEYTSSDVVLVGQRFSDLIIQEAEVYFQKKVSLWVVDSEIFSLIDNNENKIYLYKSNYDLLTDYHLNSTLPISIIYSSRKRKFDIYKIFNNTLSLIEINK